LPTVPSGQDFIIWRTPGQAV